MRTRNGRVSDGVPRALAACVPVACAAPFLLTGSRAIAAPQDDGPVIVDVEDKWEGLQLEPIHYAVDLLARTERFKTQSPGSNRTDRYSEIRATGSAWTKGYVGHPNLLELNLLGTFGLSQQWVRSDSANRNEDPLEVVDEYDLSGVFFQKSDMPTTLYSRRIHDTINQQFGDSLDSLVTETGIQSDIRSAAFPTTLHYFHRTEEQTSRVNPTNFTIDQDTFEWFSTWKPTENQQVTWDYTLDSVTESGDLRPTNDFLRQNATGTHELNFGDNDQHQLRSNLFAYSEDGEIDTTRLRLAEQLYLRHTPRFETLYNYTVDWSKLAEQEQFFQRGSAGFRHKLYESLWTNFNVGGSTLSMPDDNFTSDQLFTDLLFDYKKKVPLGELSASLGTSFNFQADSEQGSPITVLDEPRSFPVSGIIVIQRQNLVSGSIVLTDATGFITYVEGIDYTVDEFSDRVEIRRVLGGSIPDGDAVLVDYQIGPAPAADINTWTASGGLRYDFEEGITRGLGVYMRYLHQEQDRKSKGPDVILPANVDDLVLGADYRIGYFTATAERQFHDSSLSPYEATRLIGQYKLPLGVGSFIDALSSYDMIDRTEENTTSKVMTIKGRWTQRIDRALSFAVSATYRNEKESPDSNVDAFEQTFEIFWKYRQTSVSAAIHNSFVNSNTDDTSNLTLQLAVRREF